MQIIIIGCTALGVSWPQEANVVSDVYPGHPPATAQFACVFCTVNPFSFRSATYSVAPRVCPQYLFRELTGAHNNNNYKYVLIYLLQLGCYPVAVVNKTWLLPNLSLEGYMRSM